MVVVQRRKGGCRIHVGICESGGIVDSKGKSEESDTIESVERGDWGGDGGRGVVYAKREMNE